VVEMVLSFEFRHGGIRRAFFRRSSREAAAAMMQWAVGKNRRYLRVTGQVGAAVEKAARDAGYGVDVPVTPGRTDATQEQPDADSFAYLEPKADGFRNDIADDPGLAWKPEEFLVDRADPSDLTAPEMTVLVGGRIAWAMTLRWR